MKPHLPKMADMRLHCLPYQRNCQGHALHLLSKVEDWTP